MWGSTFKVNMLRAFSAGIVWGIVALAAQISGSIKPGAGDIPWFLFPVMSVFVYPVILLNFLILGKIVATLTQGIGELAFSIMAFFAGLAVTEGDPLVYILHKKKPEWVPVEKFHFLNLTLFLAVLRP